MGRLADRVVNVGDLEAEAQRERIGRWINLKLGTSGWACDPPLPVEMFEPLRRAHARARLLPAGPVRRAAVEAVAREYVGDGVVDRWIQRPHNVHRGGVSR